ncbi:MAG: ATP-binding protein, partial [Armatimonadota bacterium]
MIVIPHLYHLTEHSPVWAELQSLAGPLAVACWLYPRPAKWALHARGVQSDHQCVIDLGAAEAADEVVAAIDDALGEASGEGRVRELEDETPARWYPVIDRSRCTSCGHCLQFCLFGVYERDGAGQIVATSPDACKPGCPACARVCPQGAIMFPLCDEPAIAGAPGTRVEPDPAARRMFYVRTGRPCPVCGQVPAANDVARARP